jgi:hypothetical protein
MSNQTSQDSYSIRYESNLRIFEVRRFDRSPTFASSMSNFGHLRPEPYGIIQTVFNTNPFIFGTDTNLALLALSTRAYWSRA